MKLRSFIIAGLFAAGTALSLGVQAAADADKGTNAKVLTADSKMQPHSHVEEKTGTPQKAPAAKTDKADPGKDKSKHLHPRDGK